MIFFEPSAEGAAGSIRVWETATKCVNKSIKNLLPQFTCVPTPACAHMCTCVCKLVSHFPCTYHVSREKKRRKRALPKNAKPDLSYHSLRITKHANLNRHGEELLHIRLQNKASFLYSLILLYNKIKCSHIV